MLILADSGSVHQVVFTSGDNGFCWIDVAAPDRPSIERLSNELGCSEDALDDCLDTHQLPKVNRRGDYTFILVRLHAGIAASSAGGVYEMTQPLAIFLTRERLVTVHRRDHPVLFRLRKRYAISGPTLEKPAATVTDDLLNDALGTFDGPLSELSGELVDLETTMLNRQLTEATLEQIFLRKRRATVLSWVLLRTREALSRAHLSTDLSATGLHEPRETLDALHVRARELVDYTDNLLNLQIAIASHRTNEVMRLLTVMSAIFMPLTFIVGVYGMNFDAPEFRWRFGYFAIWIVIVAVFFGILRWFRRRGLLG